MDSSGLRKAEGDLRSFGSSANSTFSQATGAADSFAAAMVKQVAIYGAITAAAYKIGDVLVSGFKAGIKAVDDFNLTVIGVAATITDMAKDQSKGQENYSAALAYSKTMYNELELAAARYFASGQDMTQAWNILAQKGIVLKHEEIDALGVIVDRVKLSTQGQVAGLQIAQELRSMITGQARATDQVGMLLKDRIPNLEAELQKHRQIGDVVTWLASQFQGLAYASKDIQDTLESQYSTLGTLLTQVGRGGLGGAYQDIVGWVKNINDYLMTHKNDLIGGIAKGWATIAWTIEKAADAADRINKATSKEIPYEPSDRSAGESIAAGFKRAFDPRELAQDAQVFWDSASLGWDRFIQGAKLTNTEIESGVLEGLRKASELITNSAFWNWAIDYEGPKRELDNIRGKIQWVIDLISKPYNFIIKAIVTGLPSWFGGGGAAPGRSDWRLNYDETTKLASQKARGVQELTYIDQKRGSFEVPQSTLDAFAGIQTTVPETNKPGGKVGKGGGGKGGGGGADAEINRLNSLFDTLTKDIARLSEGKLSAIEADYVKTVENIFKKTSDRAHSEAEVEILAKTRATLQKTKLQDDFDLKMAKDSGDVFLEIQKQYEKDLSDFNGLAGAKEKTEANRAKRELDARIKFQEQVFTMQSTSLSALASAVPLLSQQIPIEKTLLDIELKRGDLKMEEELRVLKINHMISAGQEDEMRQLKALENQYKKYAQERKGWMLEGVSGGLKAGSLERDKEAATRTAQWTIDAMKGAEQYLGETGGQAFVDYLHGKKMDLMKMFQDMGDSLIKQVFKMATTKMFDTVWSGIGKAFGLDSKGKPDGSAANPFHVVGVGGSGAALKGGLGGIDLAEKKAGKVGMTMGGGKGGSSWDDQYGALTKYQKQYEKFYKIQTKDEKALDKFQDKDYKETKLEYSGTAKLMQQAMVNDQTYTDTYGMLKDTEIAKAQETFATQNGLNQQYGINFGTMATGVSDVWGTAQGLMTAAGVSGDTQRLMSLGGYAMQGIGIIQKFAKGTILADAYRGAAAAFAWMVELIPPPMGEILGAIAAAAAFAGISAFGMLGGVTSGIASSAGGDYQVGATGPRNVHQGETILPAWAANSWRDIVSREASGGGGRPGENGGGSSIHVGGISVTINNPPKDFDANKLAKKLVPALQRQIKLNRLRTG